MLSVFFKRNSQKIQIGLAIFALCSCQSFKVNGLKWFDKNQSELKSEQPVEQNEQSSNSKFKLKISPFWIQNTLEKENIGFRKVNRFTPILFKDLIIVANALDGLSAYDIYQQSLVWRMPIELGIESNGVTFDNRLFVGALNGIFYSIDLDTRQIVWQFDTKSELVAEPLLHEGVVYFLSGANVLYALDMSTGRQVWVYNRQDTTSKMTIRGGAKPAISGSVIYQGFSDGSLVALNVKTGTPQWEVLLNKNSKFKDLDGAPVVDGDVIYVNSYDDRLYAISKDTGTILFKGESGGSSTPLVLGQNIIFSTSKGQILSVNKTSGEKKWSYNKVNGVATDIVLHKGKIVVGESQGSLLFLDALTGNKDAEFDPGRGLLSRPVSDKNKRVYFISGEANLYGILVEKEKINLNFPWIR